VQRDLLAVHYLLVHEDGSVVLLLDARKLYINDSFLFGWNVLLDLWMSELKQYDSQLLEGGFLPLPINYATDNDTHRTKHEGRDIALQRLNLFSVCHVAKVGLELFKTAEETRLDKVKQRPELLGVILQRCSGHENPALVSILQQALGAVI